MKKTGLYRAVLWLTLGAVALAAGCGGGGGSGNGTAPGTALTTPSVTPNVQAIVIDAGPANSVNVPFVSVTLCAPGSTTNCQTIDHVALDTGSTGLRIFSSVLSSPLAAALPQQTVANGAPLAECAQFADGSTWGAVKIADIQLAGEKAGAVPIHIMGDPAFAPVPAACTAAGPLENTVQSFGANGILGLSVFRQDCGTACAQNANIGFYYACTSAGCQPTTASEAVQVKNPVALFASDNNGVLITLPAVAASGAPAVTGTLSFGIGTQANNALGNAAVLTVNPTTGNFTTTYKGRVFSQAFIDSGSNAYYFFDNSLPRCPLATAGGFDCPLGTQNLSASNQGANGRSTTVNFGVANAATLFGNNPAFTAFGLLAGPSSDTQSFAWGLPFFYGRSVFTAIEGQATPGGVGPWVAY